MFVRRAYIPDSLQPEDCRTWPFTVPCVAELAAHGLEFTRPVTFLVGDNGSGKSTLVESIAEGLAGSWWLRHLATLPPCSKSLLRFWSELACIVVGFSLMSSG